MVNCRPIQRGTVKNTIYVELYDAATPFLPKAAFAYNTAGIILSYNLKRGARVAITPITLASPTAAWAAGGVVLVDDTNQPGLVRFDLPDAMFTTYDGVSDSVIFTIAATGYRTSSVRIALIDRADVYLLAGTSRANS